MTRRVDPALFPGPSSPACQRATRTIHPRSPKSKIRRFLGKVGAGTGRDRTTFSYKLMQRKPSSSISKNRIGRSTADSAREYVHPTNSASLFLGSARYARKLRIQCVIRSLNCNRSSSIVLGPVNILYLHMLNELVRPKWAAKT